MTKNQFSTSIVLMLLCGMWALADQTPQPPAGGRGQGGRGGRGGPARVRTRKAVLAWADTRNGIAQHESVSHALAVIERLGYESGTYDTYIRTDSNIVAKQPLTTTGAPASGGPSLSNVDAIFFLGHREVALQAQQRAELAAFVRDEGKGFVAAHTALNAFESWPEFGELLGGRYDGMTTIRGASPAARSSTKIHRSRPRSTSRRPSPSSTSFTRRRNSPATSSACCSASTWRRCRRAPSCGVRIAIFPWRGQRCTARGASSTRRSVMPRKPGTTATWLRCTSRQSSGRLVSPRAMPRRDRFQRRLQRRTAD